MRLLDSRHQVAGNSGGSVMKCGTSLAALIYVATVFSYVGAAKAADSLDEQIASLEKENAALKKSLRLDALQKENAELRKRLNGSSSDQPRPQTVRSSSRQNDVAGASSALAYAPRASSTHPNNYPAVQPPFAQSWTGVYVGGSFGGALTSSQISSLETYRAGPANLHRTLSGISA